MFSQSSTDVSALLPCAMLPRQARGTHKKHLTKPTVQLILSLSTNDKYNFFLPPASRMSRPPRHIREGPRPQSEAHLLSSHPAKKSTLDFEY